MCGIICKRGGKDEKKVHSYFGDCGNTIHNIVFYADL